MLQLRCDQCGTTKDIEVDIQKYTPAGWFRVFVSISSYPMAFCRPACLQTWATQRKVNEGGG